MVEFKTTYAYFDSQNYGLKCCHCCGSLCSGLWPFIQFMLNILLCIEIDWPSEFDLCTAAYWTANMKINPLFYYFLIDDTSEKLSTYENLLLKLASNALKRKIVFVSIFEDIEGGSEFQPANDLTSKTVYYIAGLCTYFFLRIFKNICNSSILWLYFLISGIKVSQI